VEIRIADTFTDSLSKLNGDEQKAVKTTAFDLQMNPANPGMKFHRLDRSRDQNFWSVRVSLDVRLIVHKTDASLMLCYVDHHDDAYQWAERRKLETHPKTGAAQLVEVRETVREIPVPVYIEEQVPTPPKEKLFASIEEDVLLTYGVPTEWIQDVLDADEDSIFKLIEHLPAEAGEALLDLAIGITPPVPIPAKTDIDPFDHPDAQRRFRVMTNIEELERALEFPWDKWAVFLHPSQREVVDREFAGSARVSGSAGTGKTIVALHRAVHLARTNSDSRVLLTTFSDTLANALRARLRCLISSEPSLGERIEVQSVDAVGDRLFQTNFGTPSIVTRSQIRTMIKSASVSAGEHRFSEQFLFTEWEQVVDAWQLDRWDSYRSVERLGRKTRLPESQREILWSIYAEVRKELAEQNLITRSEMFGKITDLYLSGQNLPFNHIVVDEAQDVSVAELRFLAAIGSQQSQGLFFAGDLGQRIFQQPFSWLSQGVDIRGRSRSLRVNYRTSHQIRKSADRLLGSEITDVDGVTEDRRGTISVFNGPPPTFIEADSPQDEINQVSNWIRSVLAHGVSAGELAVFVRSDAEFDRAIQAVEQSEVEYRILDQSMVTSSTQTSISTMHLAKGLEFRAVVVMACDDEIIPSQERIDTVVDDSDLKEVYNTERHLLYVACTRARDHLLISGVDPVSEFVDDLGS
jgi:mRNA-degrading endonuclease RelE of RelBE toxin-antitoxin system